MPGHSQTETQQGSRERSAAPGAIPGLAVIFSVDRPQCLALPLAGRAIELGRDELAAAGIPDSQVSRRHVRVEHDDGRFSVRDLDSRNGTFVNGRRIESARQLAAPVLRIGRTLILPVADVRPFANPGVTVKGGVVMGPCLRAAHDRIAAIARSGASLLVRGESGSGKERGAATFHTESGREGRPFVAVNCATIPKELAERTLFGARRGAYTGAVSDAVGLVTAADSGTLFLDEIAELDTGVQAKLLRVLETRTVLPLGAVHPIEVDVRVCTATHKNLREEVAAGRFREDLYFRLGRPEVFIPPLRERREEIPWLLERAVEARTGVRPRVTPGFELVEACLLRPWPGNVRELFVEAAAAAVAAAAAGRTTVGAADLGDEAGLPLHEDEPSDEPAPAEHVETPAPDAAALQAALRAEHGNIARTAARLRISRSRLRRLIEREGIDLQAVRSS